MFTTSQVPIHGLRLEEQNSRKLLGLLGYNVRTECLERAERTFLGLEERRPRAR